MFSKNKRAESIIYEVSVAYRFQKALTPNAMARDVENILRKRSSDKIANLLGGATTILQC